MNAQDLWSGNDYAHTDNISRGVPYYYNATRVKVLNTFKQNGYGSQRATTMVNVIVCRNDGVPLERVGQPVEKTVRARDIFMRWEEYERETKYREDEKETIAQREEDERIRDQTNKDRILSALEDRGIDRLIVTGINEYYINLNRAKVEEWLGIS